MDREEPHSILVLEGARGLVFNAGFEEKVAGTDEGSIAYFSWTVGEFGALMRIEEVVVSRNLEIQTQDMIEYHVKSVS